MKLELKHLSPYLPYGLKIHNDTFGVMEMACWGAFSPIESGKQIHIQGVLSGAGKPILRPLSDLTKEIQHNGESFVPIVELAKIEFDDETDAELNTDFTESCYEIELEYLPSWFALRFHKTNNTFSRWDDGEGASACKHELLFKLFEWHFDVFGLLEAGLAINMNKMDQ